MTVTTEEILLCVKDSEYYYYYREFTRIIFKKIGTTSRCCEKNAKRKNQP